MKRVTPWSRPRVPIAQWEGSALTLTHALFAPVMIRDLEARKSRSLYTSDADFAVGYDATCKAQEALLMDVSERLQMEIRAMRGGDAITSEVRDPEADPFNLPLETLAGITNNLDLARSKLEEIRALIASGGNSEEILEQLGQVVLLLG